MLTNVVGSDGPPPIGTPVQVVWTTIDEELVLPAFEVTR